MRPILKNSFQFVVFACFIGITTLIGVVPSVAFERSASVTVTITIPPSARAEFPDGTSFQLRIPSRQEGLGPGGPFAYGRAPHVALAQVPFTVLANTPVTVSVLPGDLMEAGSALGAATRADGGDTRLPYRVRLEFPLGVPNNPLAGNGGNGRSGDDVRSADPRGALLSGIVHIVPAITWGEIASRRFSASGLYVGNVEVVVSTGD